jgi:hypothetical protein
MVRRRALAHAVPWDVHWDTERRFSDGKALARKPTMGVKQLVWLNLAQLTMVLAGCGGRADRADGAGEAGELAGSSHSPAGAGGAEPRGGEGGSFSAGAGADPGGGGAVASADSGEAGSPSGGRGNATTGGASGGGADGGAGAAQGGSAGQAAAGEKSGGSAGVAGAATTCLTGVLFAPPPALGTRETFSGSNGVFTDSCENGNLVQRGCGVTYVTGPPGDPGPFPLGNGEVVSTNVDCGGRCVDGACPDVCPALGTTLEYVSVDAAGSAVLTQDDSGWSYTCEFYGSSGGVDCATVPAGSSVEVVEDISEALCVGLVIITVGIDSENRCKYYQCVATPL